MEKVVLFRDRQELQAVDLSNIQTYAQASIDHVVKDAVQNEKGWADFTVTKSGTAEVTVSAGRLYNGGSVYVAETPNVFELLDVLPATNKRWIALVAWGRTQDVDVQPRDFLKDATTGATEPRSVAMQALRLCMVEKVVGVEAPQPLKPTISSSNLVIAWLLVGPTDVESINVVTANKLPQVARVAADLKVLQDWKNLIEPRVNALASDLAALQARVQATTQRRSLDTIAADVARLKEIAGIPDDHTDYGSDYFLNTSESDTSNSNFLCKVEEGVRFSDENANLTSLQVFNPLNPNVVVANNFLLPKYTSALRFTVGPFYEGHSISQYQYQTHQMVQKTRSRERIRYGETITVCTNYAWWQSGRYDQAQGIFYKDGDTWEVLSYSTEHRGDAVRLRKFWRDTYTEYYWDRITIDHTISGQQIAQTFLNAQDGWLTKIGLYFTQKGSTGNVDVAISEVAYGQPDNQSLIGKVTLNVADIQTSADGTTETQVPFPATFLEAGKRYAIVITTGGNHFIALAQGTQYAQGTFFISVDGAYQQGTFQRDMMFSLYYAQFEKTRTVVDLTPLSLSGGITYIDIMAPLTAPKSTNLVFEIQVAGVWYPLEEVKSGHTPLYGLPPLLPFRATFNGTTDVQPGIEMTTSKLFYSRPRTTFKHISQLYTLASGTQSFKVVAILENYYETNHNLTCTIQKNGSGSQINPATTVDEELDPPVDPLDANHKRIRRTFTWTSTEITSSMTSVKITMDGATTSALDVFHVGERTFIAL